MAIQPRPRDQDEARKKNASGEPPTVERFRDDIDQGRTGEKVDYPDPAAAPLGADEEAADSPVTPEQREIEARARAQNGPTPATRRQRGQELVVFYAFIICVIALVLLTIAYWLA